LKIKLFTILIIIAPILLFGQTDTSRIKRVGIISILDCAYNFQDRVLSPNLGRKWTAGISLTNKEGKFIGFFAVGLKGFKFNLYSPKFRESFSNDVKQHYVPINGMSEDSLIGARMGAYSGIGLWGTYSQYIQVGFILNKKLKPSCSFYTGWETFLLYDRGFAHYEDPENGDIDYVAMRTTFYEFKIGCALPVKWFSKKPFCLNLNVGYKWVNYGILEFEETPLSAYTTGSLEKKYHASGKITVSLSFIVWLQNWR